MDAVEIARKLGITDMASFDRFAQDKEVRDAVSWLLHHTQNNKVDLLNYEGWKHARGEFLVRSHNADTMLNLHFEPEGNDVKKHTSAVVVTAFERMERRRGEMGLELWRSMSMRWRVYYGVVQLYLEGPPEVLRGLVTIHALEGWTEANRKRLVDVRSAMFVYTEMLSGR